jgi:dihydrofolate reductase
MRAILAINNKGYIGLKGGLPWRCSKDLEHFKKETMGGKLLVGHRTAKHLPKLPGRELMVFDKNETTIDYTSADWCIGGKATYEKFCHLFTELHVSIINDDTIGDVMGPDLRRLNPDCVIFEYHFEKDVL